MLPEERLSACPFFEKFAPASLAALAAESQVREFKAGQDIFLQNDPGDFLGIIESGVVEIVKTLITGEEKPLAELRAGEVVGERALLEPKPRSAGTRAKSAARLFILDREAMLRILEEHPAAGVDRLSAVAQALSRRLRFSSAHLV